MNFLHTTMVMNLRRRPIEWKLQLSILETTANFSAKTAVHRSNVTKTEISRSCALSAGQNSTIRKHWRNKYVWIFSFSGSHRRSSKLQCGALAILAASRRIQRSLPPALSRENRSGLYDLLRNTYWRNVGRNMDAFRRYCLRSNHEEIQVF